MIYNRGKHSSLFQVYINYKYLKTGKILFTLVCLTSPSFMSSALCLLVKTLRHKAAVFLDVDREQDLL